MKKILLFALVTLVAACNTKPKKFAELYQEYADSVMDGYQIEVAKKKTERGGEWAVFSVEYDGVTQYVAIDLSTFDPKEVDTVEEFLTYAAGLSSSQVANVASNGDGTYTDGTYTYETTTNSGKDLEKVGAVREIMKVKAFSDKLSGQFGFSQTRAQEVAKFMVNFGKISKSRTLTKSDYDAFSAELIGTDFGLIEEAMSGNTDSLEALIDSAADRNNVSPEAIRLMIQEAL